MIQLVQAGAYALGLTLCGMVVWPFCRQYFGHLPDKGLSSARIAGLAMVSLVAWLLHAYALLPFSAAGVWGILAALSLASLLYCRKRALPFLDFSGIGKREILISEGIFWLCFTAWLLIRSCAPDIAHTEQPMNLMLLHAIWYTPDFPPQDLWLAGHPVSYYYFGHWLQVVPARLFSIPPPLAYNMAQAAWLAMLMAALYGLGRNMLAAARRPALAGLFIAAFVILGSNPAGFRNALATFSADAPAHWWWWRASRTIMDPGGAELITEFPFFSFLLGDNHPHVFVLPLLVLFNTACLNLLMQTGETRNARSLLLRVLPPAILTGLIYVTNSWNAPLCALLAMTVIAETGPSWRPRLVMGLAYLVITPLLALLLFLPYHLTAATPIGGIAFAHGIATRFRDLTNHLGFMYPGILLLLLLPLLRRRDRTLLSSPGFRLALCLAFTGLVALLIPEGAYIIDVFNNRMNTVFKFYYQAWLGIGVASAYTLALCWNLKPLRTVAVILSIALLCAFVYPVRALHTHTNRFVRAPAGLDGAAWMRTHHPALAEALEWIRSQTPPNAVFLTPAGHSYQAASAPASVFAGRPAILGWTGHQRQWRGAAYQQLAGDREQMIDRLFRLGKPDALLSSPLRNRIDYLFVPLTPDTRKLVDSLDNFPSFSVSFSNRMYMIYKTP